MMTVRGHLSGVSSEGEETFTKEIKTHKPFVSLSQHQKGWGSSLLWIVLFGCPYPGKISPSCLPFRYIHAHHLPLSTQFGLPPHTETIISSLRPRSIRLPGMKLPPTDLGCALAGRVSHPNSLFYSWIYFSHIIILKLIWQLFVPISL